jgi:hypothetical protein
MRMSYYSFKINSRIHSSAIVQNASAGVFPIGKCCSTVASKSNIHSPFHLAFFYQPDDSPWSAALTNHDDGKSSSRKTWTITIQAIHPTETMIAEFRQYPTHAISRSEIFWTLSSLSPGAFPVTKTRVSRIHFRNAVTAHGQDKESNSWLTEIVHHKFVAVPTQFSIPMERVNDPQPWQAEATCVEKPLGEFIRW